MERTSECLRQKRIELVNAFVSKVKEIERCGGEPNIPILLKEIDDFDYFVSHYWHFTWNQDRMMYLSFD